MPEQTEREEARRALVRRLESANDEAFVRLCRRAMTDDERARYRERIEQMVREMESEG